MANKMGLTPKELLFFWCILVAILCLSILSILFQYPNIDEAIIGECAYRLAQDGKASSFLYEGLHLGYEQQVFIFHKLFTLLGAGVATVFGLNYYIIKLVSLVFFIGVIWAIWKYLNKTKLEIEIKNRVFLTTIFILGLNTLIYNQGLIFRPETMMMFLGFASFFFISKALHGDKNAPWIAGIIAGVSVTTHLNGVIFMGAGGLVLLIHKRSIFEPIKFAIPAVLVALLFFVDINSKEKVQMALFQWSHEPNMVGAEKNYLIKLFTEHKRFFHGISEILLTLPFFIFSIAYRKRISRLFPGLLSFAYSAIIIFGLLSHGKTPKYLLLFYPYLTIVTAFGLVYLWNKSRKNQYLLYSSIALYIAVNIVILSKDINIHLPNLQQRNQTIVGLLPDKTAKIMAPECTIFGTIETHQIVGVLSYYHYCLISGKDSEKNNPVEFLSYCDQNNYKYIINDFQTNTDKFWNKDFFKKCKVGDKLGLYTVLYQSNGILILEKK
jgi:hypothetical protein